ncbi:hypothetical protein C7999DRAFT_43015 [Corynascus novoguineensis]|uniref:Uncharacterized protein n=1 Tax=Corynascus novoguineensis TaxID=1126955 RepID=A0AAN7CPE9_9PEZI|nr:hypothetical protein C7999DRAFT_43015 [Corynascus novoguineensis]
MDISKNYPLGLSAGLGISSDEPPSDNTTTPDWLSRRDAAILRSPYTVIEASEYHEPAILRVWGISHDDAENVDLLQPCWFDSRQTVRYPSVTFSEARRHRKYQLNRLSNHDDWRPIGRVVKVLLEPEPGTKRITHIPGVIMDDTDVIVEMVDKDNGKVTHLAMSDGFERYLDRLRGQNPKVIASPRRMPSTDVERQLAGQAADCPVAPIRRGRYRRMRRHGGIGLQTEIKERSRTMPPLEQPKDTVIVSQITSDIARSVVRGRRRRQSKRHGFGLSQVEASLSASNQATFGTEKSIAIAVSARLSSDILSCLPGGSRLNPEASSFLVDELPVVWLQVRDPDKFDSELLVLPIYHDDGDKRPVGRLVVPKKSVQVWEGHSWAQHMASNEADFWVEILFVLDGSRSSHESAHYWDKFFPEAFDDYTYGLWPSFWAGDVELALQASMQTPPLVFPDLIPGALANVRMAFGD